MRLFSSGFESNSSTAAMEWDAVSAATFSSTTVRSGGFSGRVSSLSSGVNQRFRCQFKSAAANGPFYFRFYFRVATRPSAENRIFALSSNATAGVSVAAYITVDSGGLLRLYDNVGIVGAASSALTSGTWYCVEVMFDRTGSAGSQRLTARINGTVFATGIAQTLGNSISQAYYGGNLVNEIQTVGDWFFDDIAINDTTGSAQTGYPGPGSIVYLRPTAAGDSNTFATQTGGTAGAANNFSRVSEVTPDDATTFNGSSTLNEEDFFNVADTGGGILATDLVAFVAVNIRFRNSVADATAALKAEIKKVASGTILQSSAIVPNSTSWKTNATATPLVQPLVAYTDPDGLPWRKATLDTLQVGYKLTAAGTNRIDVSNICAVVETSPRLAGSDFLALL